MKQTIWFSHDSRGRKVAHRWDRRQMRAFRMPLAEAELLRMTEQADVISGHPMHP
jgi:hypothetical protein